MEIELTDEQLKALAELVARRILDIAGASNALSGETAGKAMPKSNQMDIKQVAASFGVSTSSIRVWLHKDLRFPAPISVGAKLVWDRLDIERHKAALKKRNDEKFHPRGRYGARSMI